MLNPGLGGVSDVAFAKDSVRPSLQLSNVGYCGSLFSLLAVKMTVRSLSTTSALKHLVENDNKTEVKREKTSKFMSQVPHMYNGRQSPLPSTSYLSPLTFTVIRAAQMTLQQYLSLFPCLLLPSGNLQTPFPPIPWCSNRYFCLPLLAPFTAPLQNCLRHARVSGSSTWLGGHNALQLHSGFCCEPPRSWHCLWRKCSDHSFEFCCQGPAQCIKEGG